MSSTKRHFDAPCVVRLGSVSELTGVCTDPTVWNGKVVASSDHVLGSTEIAYCS